MWDFARKQVINQLNEPLESDSDFDHPIKSGKLEMDKFLDKAKRVNEKCGNLNDKNENLEEILEFERGQEISMSLAQDQYCFVRNTTPNKRKEARQALFKDGSQSPELLAFNTNQLTVFHP